jgi:predicted transcriptional regulator YdeE
MIRWCELTILVIYCKMGVFGMEPRLASLVEIKVVGIETRTSNQKETDPSSAKIPGHWKRFFEEEIVRNIPNSVRPDIIFAVYTNYQSDHKGEYSLILTARVSSLESIPAGMTGITIPPSRYLVFPAIGKMPDSIIRTWGNIWKYFYESTQYTRSYTADFEIYDKRSQSENPEVDIYIAVR